MISGKILELKEHIINQANMVEKMISMSIEGLLNKDVDLLKHLKKKLEKKVDKGEIKIDEACASILALFHPEAKDLRTVFMISKMNYDLERMGDHCVNIAQSAIFLSDKELVKPLVDLPRMAEETLKMLQDCMKSFINENTYLANNVCERDQVVDDLADQIFRELLTYMIASPKTIERSMSLLRISGNFERIADLTTNIAEDVIYIVEGRIVKHRKIKKIKDEEKTEGSEDA